MDDGQQREPEPDKTVEEGQDLKAEIKAEQSDGELVAGYDPFCKIKQLLERGDVTGAQARLDEFDERGAEWHYLQSIVYRKRNWLAESKKSLETAIGLNAENEEYKKALEELEGMADSGKKRKRSSRAMGGVFGNACLEGGGECCVTVVCELGCQLLCEGLGGC